MSSTPTREPVADEPQLSPQTEDQGKEIAPFLRSLRRMLDRESDAILCWTADGRAFEIHDMDVMTSYILPKYFKHAKYTSFQRQLNYFNFRKWTKSRAVVCTFSNAFFARDEPDLTWRITRKRGLSDAKSGGELGSDGGDASPRTPKARAAVQPATVPAATTPVTTKPVTMKREPVTGAKRKATSSSASTTNRKTAKASIVKKEGAAVPVPTDVAESLEWIDTLYPSLEALEAECSVTASTTSLYSNSDYSQHHSEQVAYAWPQYSVPAAVSSAAEPTTTDRFGPQPPSYDSYFVPTVVQTRCVAL